MSQKKILAIDGSTVSTGIAVYDNTKLIHYECITVSKTRYDLFTRIVLMVNKI